MANQVESFNPRVDYYPPSLRAKYAIQATESPEAQLPTAEIGWVPDMAAFQRRTAKRMSVLGPDAATLPKGWPKAMEHPLVWTGSDLCKEDYIFNLDIADISEIKEALSRLKGLDVEVQDIKRSTFPLPKLGPRLESLTTKVYDGIGFCVWTHDELVELPPPETLQGSRTPLTSSFSVAHITDVKFDGFPDDRRRPAFTNLAQPFHTDLLCGILAMYFIDRAAIGGDVLLASSWKVYNELASTRPDLIKVLGKDDWVHDTFGRNPPYHQRALLHYWQEEPVLIYSRRNLTGSASTPRNPNIPPLSEAQAEALDAVHFTAAANCVSHTPEAGDMVFINNFAILHSRSTFQDTSEAKRYILRLWLNNPDAGWDVPPGLKLAWDRIFADMDEVQHHWDIDPYDALDGPLCEGVGHTDDLDQRRGRGLLILLVLLLLVLLVLLLVLLILLVLLLLPLLHVDSLDNLVMLPRGMVLVGSRIGCLSRPQAATQHVTIDAEDPISSL
ncbi:hypothetical protein NUW58_g6684 [Xylaria curta]|uniref:Uncharacterized protein n=1 Tax=Xylaria curta TaxID=42375 RepID=A0ACC1NQ58_9PEZI|nr:hypothetical protein NUW58_g6684 [Xylaria curta]